MRRQTNSARAVWWTVVLASAFFCGPAAAAAIDDAPLDDAGPAPVAGAATPGEFRFTQQTESWQSRVYTLSVLDYAHIRAGASPLFINNGVVRSRSARQELNGEWTYKPAAGWTLKADGQAQYSTSYDTATALYAKGAQDWLKVNELFAERYFGRHWSLLAGKYRRVFGPGVFQNPMDRHNPVAALPGQPVQREGAWLAQAAFEPLVTTSWLSDVKASVAVLPRYYVDKNGWPSTRGSVIAYHPLQTQNGGLGRDAVEWTERRAGVMARLYANLFGGDANLVAYRYDALTQWGAAYQRYVHPMVELHGEMLLAQGPRYDVLPGETPPQRPVSALVGARLEYDTDTGAVIEYFYQGEQPENFPTSVAAQRMLMARVLNVENQLSLLMPLRQYALVSLYSRNIRDRFSVTGNVMYGIAQSDAALSLRGEARVGAVAKLALTAAANVGDARSYYGGVTPNDWRVTSEIEVVF